MDINILKNNGFDSHHLNTIVIPFVDVLTPIPRNTFKSERGSPPESLKYIQLK